MTLQYLLVAAGGAMGALARFQLGIVVRTHFLTGWPAATLAVNLLGALGIGVVSVLLERNDLHPEYRSLLVIGFFGAFTTFSTFSFELLHMIQRAAWHTALGYALVSLAGCLLGAAAGVWLTRMLL